MTKRLEAEVGLLRTAGWQVVVGPKYEWIVVKEVPLPDGWNGSATDVLIRIRPGYPTTPPDNFYTRADLRLAGGGKPGRAPRLEAIAGKNWLMFSYHVQDGWEPHADPDQGHNLLTYFDAVRMRLAEAN